MTANPISSVRLTKKGDKIGYRMYPANPVFECHLDPDILQRLISDPGSILRKNPKTIFFWLPTLINCIGKNRQFVFETFPTRDTNKPPIELAARTLFQLDGDMLLKIDEHILTRTDGIEILKAHFCWINWCLEQLKSAFQLSVASLRHVRWLLLFISLFLLALDVLMAILTENVRTLISGLSLLSGLLGLLGLLAWTFSPVVFSWWVEYMLTRKIE